MKAVIPVAGAGIKLRPLTYTQPKPLIPVAGKPILGFIIDQLRSAGIDEFVFIIGYMGDKIKDYLNISYPTLNRTFVLQENREGLGHAIWTAKAELAECSEIIIHLGDTIIDADLKQFVDYPSSCLGIKKVKDPRKFGVVEFDENGKVTRVVEKPKIPKSNEALAGIYKFSSVSLLLKSLDDLISRDDRTHGEFHLTDAIMSMIEKGEEIGIFEVQNWYDCGRKDILLETNSMLLDRYNFFKSAKHEYENTIIIPPVSIGENCQISNSIIGPHVTIGNHSNIKHAIVRNSIIGNYSSIEDVILEKSVIGNDAFINGSVQNLNIGDNTEIELS
jgi:glucose-1-phosphate thymidylyltransferase